MQLLLLLTSASYIVGFAPSSLPGIEKTRFVSPVTELNAEGRRDFLEKICFFSGASLALSTPAAFADVSDGNELPNGVAQFSRLVKTRSGISRLKKRLLESSADFDKKDWDGVDSYVRRIFTSGEDMKAITPKSKKAEADKLIAELKEYSRAAEPSITARDAKGVAAILTKCDTIFQQFFDLQSNVPDQI
mmetsp:Transcript_30548/g.34839  ORF Transcript_30548/g.34839 Transcript_30548/m.34839 type:complete len:190 (-) Transcript_30548:286-855(-)|eukprot:CAMPEP_0194129612 /NCGR_PEP_ID=MMETSP0152-20130528/829_1 /TAXON_ID=1049557 /ORGANISM="Thalassiothrix antarctica, Strain L6-D1" /LENGTH=189 /DNA_ID=CAMNT_0038823897 /DNA_START=58 /DNA_END=627 /DNA_ORIENTATION=+